MPGPGRQISRKTNARGVYAVLVVLAVVLGVGSWASEPVAGQGFWPSDTPILPMYKQWAAIKAKLPPYDPPRTPDGVPDFQGLWGGAGGDEQLNVEGHEKMLDIASPPQESSISDPPNQKVPYLPWARETFLENLKGLGRGWPTDEVPKGHPRSYLHSRQLCIPAVTRKIVDGGQEIVQRPGQFIILSEDDWYRVVHTDGRPHTSPNARSWFGSARGRWEGNTLVIEFTNLNGLGWLDYSGNFYTADARLIERWRLADYNTIDYELTVDDPKTFSQPWKMNFPKRRAGSGPVGRPLPPRIGPSSGIAGVAGRTSAGPLDELPRVDDPYAKEAWEEACFEGNHQNLIGNHDVGYKWFRGFKLPQ
jgi:hypothetical protein